MLIIIIVVANYLLNLYVQIMNDLFLSPDRNIESYVYTKLSIFYSRILKCKIFIK